MVAKRFRAALLLLVLFGGLQSSVFAAAREQQRLDFQGAMAAIAAGDMPRFYALESQLRNYVLHAHLRFVLGERAIQHVDLATAKRKAIRLEQEFHGRFLAWRVMRVYRQRLRDEQQWQLLLDSAELPSAPEMRCETLRAKESLNLLQSDDPELINLWEARSLAEDCAWVLDQRLATGEVAAKYLWKRVYALMSRGRLKQVGDFKKYFNTRDQKLIQAWVAGHTKPEEALADNRWHANTELNRRVFQHLISRLSRTDPVQARLLWAQAHEQKRYDQKIRSEAARTLSLRAASDYIPEALDWLRWLPDDVQDKRSREERARLAVRLGRWPEVLEAVEAMGKDQRQEGDWRYWAAVAWLEQGEKSKAEAVFLDLAKTRSYSGFLAADRLSLPYQMNNKATPSKSAVRSSLQARAGVQRMREYLFVGLRGEAQAEWKELIKVLDAEQRAELSLMTLDWGWYDRAIVSNGRTAHGDDLRVRFPMAYAQTMRLEVDQYNLPISWVYGVTRQESLFQPEVRSGAGAVGLMQMMPSTARDMARRVGKKLYIGALENPEFNIALGTYYLRYLLDRFDGNQVLATAAYNAGLARAPRWLDAEPMRADRWIESIPYRETRHYVKSVMAYATVYDWRANGRVDMRLSERMPMMPASKKR